MSVQEKFLRIEFHSNHNSDFSSFGIISRFAGQAMIILFIASFLMIPGMANADLVLGSGTEATWIYNRENGNLKFRIENGEEYTGLILRTTLDHIDSTAPDFSTRFLLSSHPGFTGPFSVVEESELAFFTFVGSGAPCPDCLTGTTDFGNIITPSLTTTDIIDNWSTISSVRPVGGTDSTSDPTAFGIVAIPEPSPILLGSCLSLVFGVATLRRRRNIRKRRS